MNHKVSNKFVEDHNEEGLYFNLFSDANVKALTRIPLVDGLMFKGSMHLSGSTFYFNPEPLKKHTRNPVVYKSKHTTFRVTQSGDFTGTMKLSAAEMKKVSKARKLIVEVFDFINLMMSQQDNE